MADTNGLKLLGAAYGGFTATVALVAVLVVSASIAAPVHAERTTPVVASVLAE